MEIYHACILDQFLANHPQILLVENEILRGKVTSHVFIYPRV